MYQKLIFDILKIIGLERKYRRSEMDCTTPCDIDYKLLFE